MTRSQPTPAAAVLVAIDVAKLRNEVLIELPDARRRRKMTVTNTRPEHDRLVAELHALERPVTVGLEPTGCGSAWNRNPVGGVIGVQTGPH